MQVVKDEPGCLPLAVPLLAAARGAAPPVWVRVPVKIESQARRPVQEDWRERRALRTDCLQRLAGVLKLSPSALPYSRHAATRASEHVFW